MKIRIQESLNQDLYKIDISWTNGGDSKKLEQKLVSLLKQIPTGSYILALGSRGYSTGYYKVDAENMQWLYNNETHEVSWYVDSHYDSMHFIELPSKFRPSEKLEYEDDTVVVYDVTDSEKKIYSGLEDYEPMRYEKWKYCEELGLYYIIDYRTSKFYIKWKVA